MHAQESAHLAGEMISADNIAILKNHFPEVYREFHEFTESFAPEFTRVLPAKNGAGTLNVTKNGRSYFMHSKYNPHQEAEAIVDEYKDIEKYKYVVFYGLGLGYHLDAFVRRYPGKSFYVYEPVAEVFYQYLANRELKELPVKCMKHLCFGQDEERMQGFLSGVLQKARNEMLVIELPAHKEIFPEAYEAFSCLSQKRVSESRGALQTNYVYQKRWVVNSMLNFKKVLDSPNVLLKHGGVFRGRPAVLVSAGPSLDEEIENIRYIKKEGLAYIFSVGTAINKLVDHDIYPHAACAYDPNHGHNEKVFQKLVDRQIAEIPLIFGSSIGPEILNRYPGRRFHMITSQDTVGGYFLQAASGRGLQKVVDAPSIAVITLQLLYELGFHKVILVGQNLAYKGKHKYAQGVYNAQAQSDAARKDALWVKDVDGNDILTDVSFNRMRQQMELYIHKFENVRFINTTAGGAAIEGAPFRPMNRVIREELHEPVADEGWQEMASRCYDAAFMEERLAEMNRAREENQMVLARIKNHLNTIERLCSNRNFKQAEKTYKQLDQAFKALQANAFFKTFVLPMSRVYYQMLINEIAEIRIEKTPLKKGERIINAFGRFILECQKDIQLVDRVYPEIEAAVNTYKKEDADIAADS